MTFPTELVEHVFNVLESLELRQVKNVPHVNSGVLLGFVMHGLIAMRPGDAGNRLPDDFRDVSR